MPGQCHILHPDELHDGKPGIEAGFGYRIVYVDPSLIQQAIGAEPLPFIPDPIIRSSDFAREHLRDALDMDEIVEEPQRIEIAVALAAMLKTAAATEAIPQEQLPLPSLLRVRGLIAVAPAIRHPVADLERIADLDRWTLARQFRAAFGTSPTRFRTMRQLDRARLMMRSGHLPVAHDRGRR